MLTLFLLMYVLPFVVLTVLVEAEWFGWATVSMIAAIGTYSWLNRLEVIPFIKSHGIFCLEAVGIYIALGVFWSFAKWFLLLVNFRSEFRDAKDKFNREFGIPKGSNVPEDKVKEFRDILRHNYVKGYRLDTKPQASESKSKIVAWMAFWPCSVIGYVFNDPVRRLFNALFLALKGSYQKMADRYLSDPELK